MLKKSFLFIVILLVNNFFLQAMEPNQYQKKLESKRHLQLADGKEIIISQPGTSDEDLVKKRVFMRKGSKVLWDKTFNSDYGDEIWQGAHFIPVVPGKFSYDYDEDGYEEIAIAVWHGGQSAASSSAYVFSINEDSLVFKRRENVNYEFSPSVFKN